MIVFARIFLCKTGRFLYERGKWQRGGRSAGNRVPDKCPHMGISTYTVLDTGCQIWMAWFRMMLYI